MGRQRRLRVVRTRSLTCRRRPTAISFARDWRTAWRADPLKNAVARLLPTYLV